MNNSERTIMRHKRISRAVAVCILRSRYETTIKLTILQSLNSAPPLPRAPRLLPSGSVDTLEPAMCKTEQPAKKLGAQRRDAPHLTHQFLIPYRISTHKMFLMIIIYVHYFFPW